jgi:hypothetical protein
MSVKTKFAAAAVAALTLAGTLAATSEVQARPRWGAALGVGIAAGVLFGAAAHSYQPVYGYRRCQFVRQFDAYGNYLGNVRVCDVY